MKVINKQTEIHCLYLKFSLQFSADLSLVRHHHQIQSTSPYLMLPQHDLIQLAKLTFFYMPLFRGFLHLTFLSLICILIHL